MKSVLSAFSYYGGKARMAPLICDMLDYEHTTIYIEPFGGGARTLLNKPRHEVEIYNDANAGLCAFMRIMGDPERSQRLIDMLFQSDYSPEEFYRALAYCNRFEDNYIDEFARLLSSYLKFLYKKYKISALQSARKELGNMEHKKTGLIDLSIIKPVSQFGSLTVQEVTTLNDLCVQFEDAQNLFRNLYDEEYDSIIDNFDELKLVIVHEWDKKIKEVKADNSLTEEEKQERIKKYRAEKKRFKDVSYEDLAGKEKKVFDRLAADRVYDIVHDEFSNSIYQSMETVDDMKLAYSTYIVYSQSRDGMGKDWSGARFKSTFDYHGYVSNLYDVADRLKGVEVQQAGALAFLLNENYLNRKDVCFYLDPSYLKPEDEQKNLGGTYKFSSDYNAHELLLKTICNSKARILLSNYDLPLYNKYLTPARGWHRMEFETKTTVGGAKDNKRTEILWWNY